MPPSRYEPQLPIALMNSLGPIIQATRQPGRRNRLVRPSMIRTSSSSTSCTFSCFRGAPTSVLPGPVRCPRRGRRFEAYRGGDGLAIAIRGVVVTRVELIADEGRTATADVLDLGQLRVLDDTAGRVAGVGGQDDTGTTGDLLCDLVRVDMVAILFVQRNRDGSELKVADQPRAPGIHKYAHRVRLTFLNSDNISLYAV